ncbi:MAG: helix-turn-helix transcriptional regulator [Hyphomicrobium aestuarii]|nr:helix-turn-helix transcriptional regulator [Hyphomicrobium aestuarii]
MEQDAAVISLAALAHGYRLGIFRLLVVRGPSGALAGEIAGEIGIGATSASFHLKELDHAGLIHATRQGRNIRYALHVENVRKLLAFLTEDCCRGQPEFVGQLLQHPIAVLSNSVCTQADCVPPAADAGSKSSKSSGRKATASKPGKRTQNGR